MNSFQLMKQKTFLPRDAVHACAMYVMTIVSICLSVCLSVSLVSVSELLNVPLNVFTLC